MTRHSPETQAVIDAADAKVARVREAVGGHGSAMVDTTGELMELLGRMSPDTVVKVKDEEHRPVGADLGDGQDWRTVTVVTAGAIHEPVVGAPPYGLMHTGAVYLGTSWIPGPDAPLPAEDEPIVCNCKQIVDQAERGDIESAAAALSRVLADFARLIGSGSELQRFVNDVGHSARLDLIDLAQALTATGELAKTVAGRVQARIDDPGVDEEGLD